MVEPALLENTHILKKSEFHLMQKHGIPADQLLEEYGGTAKLPDKFWPPTIPPSTVIDTDAST